MKVSHIFSAANIPVTNDRNGVIPSRLQLMKVSHSFPAATYLLPVTVMVLYQAGCI